jgi:flagellar motor component MotA
MKIFYFKSYLLANDDNGLLNLDFYSAQMWQFHNNHLQLILDSQCEHNIRILFQNQIRKRNKGIK